MKRVLVVGDNPKLARALDRIIEEQSLLALADFEYRYSVVNKSPEAMIASGYSPLDIKDEANIKWILATFDLILSIHCKQIFPLAVVSSVCCVNVHPGLNPYNRGWYPQVFSILNKMPAGATIHVMNEEIDAGPTIAQQQVDILSYDSSLSLYDRVQEAEIALLEKHLADILRGDFQSSDTSGHGNYNSVGDFKKLCHLNMDAVGPLGEHIDLLRALTHGEFKNAYFVDENGRKIFVMIQLVPDLN